MQVSLVTFPKLCPNGRRSLFEAMLLLQSSNQGRLQPSLLRLLLVSSKTLKLDLNRSRELHRLHGTDLDGISQGGAGAVAFSDLHLARGSRPRAHGGYGGCAVLHQASRMAEGRTISR